LVGASWRVVVARPIMPRASVRAKRRRLRRGQDAVLRFEDIARAEASKLGLTEPQCRSYLLENLNFDLGPRERRGLHLFYQKAASLGLAPAGVDLGYEHQEVTR